MECLEKDRGASYSAAADPCLAIHGLIMTSLRACLRFVVLAFLVAAASAGPAAAHAIVTTAAPAAGSTVPGPDVQVRIQFNSRIDIARSRLTLGLPDGKTRALKLRPESGPDNLAADAAGLAPGAYKLHWQVLSVDGHISRGDVPFTVKAP